MFRPAAQDGVLVCQKVLAISAWERAQCLVRGSMHCSQGLIEQTIVPSVNIPLDHFCKILPPLVLHLSELALKLAAGEAEGCFLLGTGWVSQAGLVCWPFLHEEFLYFPVLIIKPIMIFLWQGAKLFLSNLQHGILEMVPVCLRWQVSWIVPTLKCVLWASWNLALPESECSSQP